MMYPANGSLDASVNSLNSAARWTRPLPAMGGCSWFRGSLALEKRAWPTKFRPGLEAGACGLSGDDAGKAVECQPIGR